MWHHFSIFNIKSECMQQKVDKNMDYYPMDLTSWVHVIDILVHTFHPISHGDNRGVNLGSSKSLSIKLTDK